MYKTNSLYLLNSLQKVLKFLALLIPLSHKSFKILYIFISDDVNVQKLIICVMFYF